MLRIIKILILFYFYFMKIKLLNISVLLSPEGDIGAKTLFGMV